MRHRTPGSADEPDPPYAPEPESETAASASARPRRLGAASVTGNTRESNQDRVRVGVVGAVAYMVIADGLGGLPRGGEAAEAATEYARIRLEEDLPRVQRAGMEGVRTLLLGIIWGAATHLACVVAERGWIAVEAGFRTTLILVVALDDTYVTTWIGDGGVFVERAGELTMLLEPHKAPDAPDVLHASLGPTTDGRPSWAIMPRLSGDLLVAATDGIADVFDVALATSTRACLTACEGDAMEAAATLVENIARVRDEVGFVVTDNLTLAILTTEEHS